MLPSHKLKLGVGVVTFNNSKAQLDRFLRSYRLSSQGASHEIETSLVFIDNGSPSSLRELPETREVPSRGNIGFASAMNLLMKTAFHEMDCDYFLTANPDGIFHRETIFRLMEMGIKNPNSLIEACVFPEEHPKAYDLSTLEVAWASGCCLLIPKKIYEATGGFDEKFFLYLEDVDFSWRVRLAGYSTKICPRALFGHALFGRPEESAPLRKLLLISGRYFAWKWGTPQHQLRCERELEKEFDLDIKTLPRLIPGDKISPGKAIADTIKREEFFIFSPTRW